MQKCLSYYLTHRVDAVVFLGYKYFDVLANFGSGTVKPLAFGIDHRSLSLFEVF